MTRVLTLSGRQLSPQELQHQESLIAEREAEIRDIETGIHELHEIFRDLGTLVQEQGGMLGTQFSLCVAFSDSFRLCFRPRAGCEMRFLP